MSAPHSHPDDKRRELLVTAISLCSVRVGGRELPDDERAMILDAMRAQSNGPSDTALSKANAAIGQRVRMLVNGGSFDLRDSPKSFVGNVERLVREADEAHPSATEEGGK